MELFFCIQNLTVISLSWEVLIPFLLFREHILKQSPGRRFRFWNGRFENGACGLVYCMHFIPTVSYLFQVFPQLFIFKSLSFLVTVDFLSIIDDQCGVWIQQKWAFAVNMTTGGFWSISVHGDLLRELCRCRDKRQWRISAHLFLGGLSFPVVLEFS